MGYKINVNEKKMWRLKRTFGYLLKKYYVRVEWSTRKQPHIFYKHIFRNFACEQVEVMERVADIEEQATGIRPNHATLHNSLQHDIYTFPLPEHEITNLIRFLCKHYTINYEKVVKTKIHELEAKGYTKKQIAKKYRIHEDALNDLFMGKKLSLPLLNYIEETLCLNITT